MADQKISADTLATPVDADFFPFVTAGNVNRRSLFSTLVSYLKTALGGYFSGGGANYVSSGYYYMHPVPTVVTGAVWSAAGQIALSPIVVNTPMTVKAMAIRVATLFAGGNVAVGIYANNPATNKPTGNPLMQVSGLSTAAATAVSAALGATVVLQPGIYWAAVQMDNTTAVLSCPSNAATGFNAALVGGTLAEISVSATSIGVQYYVINGTYPTLPDVTATSWTGAANGNRNGYVLLQAN